MEGNGREISSTIDFHVQRGIHLNFHGMVENVDPKNEERKRGGIKAPFVGNAVKYMWG